MIDDAPSAVDFSVDELTALAGLVRLCAFPGASSALTHLSLDADDAALAAARRSLLARGIVAIGAGGTLKIESRVAAMLGVVLHPGLVLRAHRRDTVRSELRLYYATHAFAVEHSLVIGDVHRLASFSATDLVVRLLAFTQIDTKSVTSDGASCTLERDVFERLQRNMLGRNDDEVAAPLPREASTFAHALVGFRASGHVRCVYRRNGLIEHGELTWVDTEPGGLWTIDAGGGEASNAVVVQPVAGREFVDGLLARLPASA